MTRIRPTAALGRKIHLITDRNGLPLPPLASRARTSTTVSLEPLVLSNPAHPLLAVDPGAANWRNSHADRGYDDVHRRRWLRRRGIRRRIARKSVESPKDWGRHR